MKRHRSTYLSAIVVMVSTGLAGQAVQAQGGFEAAPSLELHSAGVSYAGQTALYRSTGAVDVPVVQAKSFKKKLKFHYKHKSYKKPKVKKTKRHSGFYTPYYGAYPKKYKAYRGHPHGFKRKFRRRY